MAADSPYSIDKGDTTWMIVATALVVVMTIPGLALFYGGLVRAKNILSILMQVMIIFSLISILWIVYGYSVAFTANPNSAINPFFGGLSKAFLSGVTYASDATTLTAVAGTFSKGVYLPELTFVMFQLTFAAITPALIIGAFAERMKFSAILIFMVIWFTFAYLPMAHMVWFWGGPDAYTLAESNLPYLTGVLGGEDAAKALLAEYAAAATDEAKAAVLTKLSDAVGAGNGYLFAKGALDFAGGTVVHINAGVAALVCAIVLGKRVGVGKDNMAPHNLPMTLIGTGLLFFGWFGFNAGSNLESSGLAALALLNTIIATAAATLAWSFLEWATRGHPSLLGAASGAVAGLVAVTPACGWVGPMGAIAIGFAAGAVCLWAVVWLKPKLGYDDSLDVFGVHGIGGILGALLTGVFFHPDLGGVGVTDYLAADTSVKAADISIGTQVWIQAQGVLTAIIWTAVVSFIALMIAKFTVGLRVTEAEEREGLDVTSHGERAYN
ncbi:MAG: ammonium transporter [Hyphomicrobiaceae bacterium]|nr:ammonium transporter [Hyphomicrobiaceae bacterium]